MLRSNSIRFGVFLTTTFVIVCTPTGRSQVAVPPDSAARVDIARVFYASAAEADSAEQTLVERIAELGALKGAVTSSAKTLLDALRLRTEIMRGYQKLDAYLYLTWAIDMRNRASYDREQRLSATYGAGVGFVGIEIGTVSAARLAQLIEEAPELSAYRFVIDQIRRTGEHRGSADAEATLSRLGPQLSGWQYPMYTDTIAGASFDLVPAAGVSLHPLKDRATLAANRDPEIRRRAFDALYSGLARNRVLNAALLQRLAAAGNARAALHRFDDAGDEAYAARFLSKASISRFLAQVAAASSFYQELEGQRAARLRRALGVSSVHVWDLGAAVPGATPTFQMADTGRLLVAAVAPLGEEYQQAMARLLDPAGGRSDVANGPNRKAGGFSLGFPSYTSVFFYGGFGGTYNDVRAMIHEAGHAVHRDYMRASGILPDYAVGPNFLFEAIASLNELLLLDYLHDHAASPAEREYYVDQFIDSKATIAFRTAPEAELEQAVYEEVRAGRPLTADRLDEMTLAIFSKYSIWPRETPELKRQWQITTLMYEDPFYDLNYAYAGVLALSFYERLHRDPSSFQRAFTSMLKNGFDRTPDQLLKTLVDVDLDDPNLVARATRFLDSRITELDRAR
jgi:oligoendopeptidase F